MESISRSWNVALITLREGVRSRTLIGVLAFSVCMFLFGYLMSGLILRDVGRMVVIYSLSSLSFSGMLLILFAATGLLSKDIDKRTIYIILSRNISIREYIFGKYIGMSLMVVFSDLLVVVFSFALIAKIYMANPGFLDWLTIDYIITSFSFVILMHLFVLSTVMFFSSFTSSTFLALFMTILIYVVGNSIDDVRQLIDSGVFVRYGFPEYQIKLINVIASIFPNFHIFDIKGLAGSGLSLVLSDFFMRVLYGISYSLMLLLGSSFLFSRREFP